MLHGREAEEERKKDRIRHMLTAPTRVNNNSVVAAPDFVPSPSSSLSSTDSFYKDGRKVSVGDSALFKPPQDSPPFIGIIRRLTTDKENKLKLGVNWLYRPADIKLGKGILLEAAPNEVFFSFHKDEIPGASLLHPCKVAFLPKGVELPSGICSFVCRRVYDITNKCLWWLTDQDYINERQEVVDQLLSKTRLEMHATVQPGGCSPKTMNGPTSTSQLKPSSDSVQNNASSFPSQSKGKKRERGDQGSEPIKRERFTKVDDVDSVHRPESIWTSEISKFTEKGRLVDSEGVEKLVHLMLPERNERKVDLVGRSMLAGVIAATDKFDCLNRFVQLKGLPVFDEWLQEVHKGKIGDGSSPKDSDRSVEDFLLVLLHALDKLPINLHALQMCNIGKSVNHLRSHKNLEIQKKARSLVDTWKKRVEAEMDANAKSSSHQGVTWPARSRLPEASQGRPSSVSSEIAMKSSVAQLPALKSGPVKLVQGETVTKSASSPGPIKLIASPGSVGNNLKDGQPRNTGVSCTSDLPASAARDEKSSSSSQSHNNSQSCSSDHAKTAGLPGKEDARSSTAVSMATNKIIGGSLRQRKSVNGFPGPAVSGVQRDSGSSRTSPLHRNPGSEKLQQSSLACDKALDVPAAEEIGHKFIVKIPNRGRSPAQSSSGGTLEDTLVMNSRDSSPVPSERHDQFDHNLKEKNSSYRANIASDVKTESWQSNDFKEVLTGSDEGDGSPATVPDDEHGQMGDDAGKLGEVSKDTPSSNVNVHKFGKLHDASFSSMNALIESCAKYSEGNASMSVGDAVGMNLLASVAAGEISKSDMVSPIDSPRRNMPIEHPCAPSGSRAKSSPCDVPAQSHSKPVDGVDDEDEKRGITVGTSLSMNTEAKTVLFSQKKHMGELNGPPKSSHLDGHQIAEPCLESNVKSEEIPAAAVSSASMAVKTSNSSGKEPWEKEGGGRSNLDGISDDKEKLHSSVLNEINNTGVQVGTDAVDASSSNHPVEAVGENKKNMNKELDVSIEDEPKPPAMMRSEFAKGTNDGVLKPSSSGKDVVSENMHDVTAGETDGRSHSTEKNKIEHECNAASATTDYEAECKVKSLGGNQVIEQCSARPATHKASPTLVQAPELVVSTGSKLAGTGADETEECMSAPAAASLSATGGSDLEAKVEFDLNEGFISDDGKYGESSNLRAPECSSAIQLSSPFPLPVSSVSSGLPSSITVAAAAKGPFNPPEDLLKSRGELGWKGSAATSAFRPAEPRKALEIPLGTANISLTDAMFDKPGRPLLDFDLNVPDERILEDLASQSSAQDAVSATDQSRNNDCARDALMGSISVRNSGGLDLDLNRVDEASDMGNHLTSISWKLDAPLLPAKSSSGGLLNGAVIGRMDFDLNDGPLVDEVSAEPSPLGQHTQNIVPSQPPISSHRMNSTEMGNFPSWFPRGNPYPAVRIQSILHDNGEQPFPIVAAGGPQRMLASSTSSNSYNTDVYRGAVLSSSPAVPFPSPPFQYPVFPFGTNFRLPSATFSGGSASYVDSPSGGRLCFPTVPSQVLAPVGPMSSHYPRPSYAVNFPDSNNNSAVESSRKWGRQVLDLNAGPLGPDIEGRDQNSTLGSRQLSFASSQVLTEEQLRMCQVTSGGVLKRKEPEDGLEGYKQSSWQ